MATQTLALLLAASAAAVVHAAQEVHVSSVAPAAFDSGHNGGISERLTAPAAGKKPHITFILFDD